jgi:ABC-2 type transport system permease protein
MTYSERVHSGTFLLLTFGLPALMIIAGAIAVMTNTGGGGDAPPRIGVIDATGQLAPVEQVVIEEELLEIDESISFISYESAESAGSDLLAGEIGGYLLIPGDYFQGQAVTYHAEEEPGAVAEAGIELYLQRALLGEQPEWLFERLDDPATYTYVAQATGDEVSEGPGLLVRLLTPAGLAVIFALLVFMGASQMGVAIVREKEQRAMEMVVTSARPRDLVAGKVLGLTLVSLTQFAIWVTGALIAAALALAGEIEFSALVIPWGTLAWGLALILPGYFVFALLAAGMGIIAGDRQHAQQLSNVVGLLGLLPTWLMGPILTNPDGGTALGLSFFPLTAPSVLLIRTIFTEVPTWQFLLSLGILLLTLMFAVWFVTRIFRAAMLNYGQTLRPRQVWRVLTQA